MKFAKGGNVELRLERVTDGECPGIKVSVADDGPGIKSDLILLLFSKFTTTSKRGRGLGLFFSKAILEADGGRIGVQTNETGGATFFFIVSAHNQLGKQ